MVEIKLIHYNDNIIIECIDDMNARAIVPKAYMNTIRADKSKPSYRKSPLTLIMKRLAIDFNFTNNGEYKYHYWENEKGLYYNFHRKNI